MGRAGGQEAFQRGESSSLSGLTPSRPGPPSLPQRSKAVAARPEEGRSEGGEHRARSQDRGQPKQGWSSAPPGQAASAP